MRPGTRQRGLRWAAAFGTAAALAGCGAAEQTGESAGAHGGEVFRSAGCGRCHALASAGATGATGPDLDAARPSVEQVESAVTSGRRGMPSFAGRLSAEEIRSVAAYVAGAGR